MRVATIIIEIICPVFKGHKWTFPVLLTVLGVIRCNTASYNSLCHALKKQWVMMLLKVGIK